jgi:myo-inositol-1(or 4)-monophosphatase
MHSVQSYGIDLQLAVEVAEGAARTAGALIRRAYHLPRNVQDKGINDLVTDTDRASEALIASVLRNAFPMCNIAGEEGVRTSPTSGTAPLTWWIDPLDGTYNFVHGVPRFSVSVGCIDPDGEVIAGVVYDPMFEECFRAVKGHGATCNGDPIHVSVAPELRSALAASGFPADLRARNNNTAEWAAFVPRCQGMCRMGSAALDLCYVASGRFDLYWEYGLAPWDMSAGVLIVQEAGGNVTDYSGQRFDVHKHGELLSSNGKVHAEAVSILETVRQSGEGQNQ